MAARKVFIAGNWKMNKMVEEAVALAEVLKAQVGRVSDLDMAVCPTYTALYAVGKALAGSTIQLGAQDAYIKESGAFTGEISPQMLIDVGCSWTIIGHSERRHILGESDSFLNEKLRFALASNLNVMFCIGETLDERKGGSMEKVLERQVLEGLKGLTAADLERVVIAYEPVWAIGTGETATPEQAEETHVFVRSLINKSFGPEAAQALRIQYGGSVKPDNARDLIACPNIDGFLVGGAALQAESFAGIINACL
ncbi:MAG: triose-phosphate isomerase [Candidatus Hydrogenedentes bacterium]|jgi:triosephosphate isomerase|nr:triose-phosphate isomerase [Candidatus Hydrogenedentota bacterium]